uniref:Protein SIEVE ELEMENT OCCLUSION C n=1 Tax=Kalanchoe fedtschenkoi TaxID=63787 RepID=A0A7N0TFB8_KALFE
MNLLSDDSFLLHSLIKLDGVLMKNLLISHDPDDRAIDSEQLLQFVEGVIFCDTPSQSSVSEVNCVSDFELIRAKEPLGNIISKASSQIACTSNKESDVSARTMALFDLLGCYRWDAKVVIVLAAFAMTYGEWWLIMQLHLQSHLAASIANLKRLPTDARLLQHKFKAIRSVLFHRVMDLTRSIIRFYTLPTDIIQLDGEAKSQANPQVYAAAYWVIRSTLMCSSRIVNLVSAKYELNRPSTAAIWELTSLANRMSSICNPLKQQVETCHQQIELKLRRRLKNLYSEVYANNQVVLRILLGMHDEFPLKDNASQAKPKGVSELKNKVVLLLVSTPELLQVETLLLLGEKLYHQNLNDSYELVWVPISASSTWSDTERGTFKFLSDSMPWRSIRKPWLLSPAVVDYIKQAWEFKGEPVMAVLDTLGVVVNSSALDMALIWGAAAFPFSGSRESELWKEAKWTLEFLLDDIDPLVSTWIEEGRDICIFGGNDAEWIKEFSTKMKDMINAGLRVKVVYVGAISFSQLVTKIFTSSDRRKTPSVSLSATRQRFFWLRLESMRRSKLQMSSNDDEIMHQLDNLLALKCRQDGWAIMGTPKDSVKVLQGREVTECLSTFSSWGCNVASLGLLGAIRSAAEPPPSKPLSSPKPGPCNHFKAVAYSDELVGRTVICDHCKGPMEMFFMSE